MHTDRWGGGGGLRLHVKVVLAADNHLAGNDRVALLERVCNLFVAYRSGEENEHRVVCA